jgi:hypothetical protein
MAIHKGLPGFETAPEDEQKKQLQRIFREVFSTEQGKIVFNILLDDMRFFKLCDTEQDKSLNEYAKFMISERMGINNIPFITNNMLTAYTPVNTKKPVESGEEDLQEESHG